MSKIIEGIQLSEKKKKPKPTSPEKWSRAKAKARSKFDVYPSAYANAYAAKEYKKMGGGWRMGESTEEVDESALQAYLGNKKYGKDGMNALRRAGREGASREQMAKIRDRYNKLDEEIITQKTIHDLADSRGIKWDNEPSFLRLTKRLTGKEHLDQLNQEELIKVKKYLENQGVAEGSLDENWKNKLAAGALSAAMGLGAMGAANAQNVKQTDLGNDFVSTSIEVAGHNLNAVYDDVTKTYFTLNKNPNTGYSIYKTPARYIAIKNGKVEPMSKLGPKTLDAMYRDWETCFSHKIGRAHV